MPKKIVSLPLCFFLFLISTVFAPCTFAADVETVGDLKVGGVIESTSGGFKFPDGTTWTTGSMDGLHFNVGFVVDDSNSNAGNLTSGAIKFGTGATGEGIASQRLAGDNQNGIDFYTNSTARLSIANNGYVGIKTRTPAFPLDVQLPRGATYARYGGTNPLFIIANKPHIGFNLYYNGGYKYGSTNEAGYLAFDQGISGGFVFATAPSGTADSDATMTTQMVITNSGNVGIGTAAPSQKLSVAGQVESTSGGFKYPDGTVQTTAVGGKEGLTILRGFIAWNGTCMGGCNGFTISHPSTGTYVITPETGVFPAGDYPSYIVTAAAAQHVAATTLGVGYATVYIYGLSDNALSDHPFSIMVIGGQS